MKNKRMKSAWLCAALVLLTVASGVVAYLATDQSIAFTLPTFAPKEPRPPVSSPLPDISETVETVVKTELPVEMRAATIKAGREFSLTAPVEEIKEQIDTAIAQAVELTMNTLLLDPTCSAGSACYSSVFMPNAAFPDGFNPIVYALEQAKAHNLHTAVLLNITDGNLYGEATAFTRIDAGLIDKSVSEIERFLQAFSADAILLDGYYNPATPDRYLAYLQSGYGGGYEHYLQALPETFVQLAAKEIRRLRPEMNIGLLTEAVWANDYEHPDGSETMGLFSTLADGNADTLSFLDKGLCDFVAVKANGSTDDRNIPYTNVLSWWDKQLSERQIPLYIVHSSDKAVTDNPGWTEYDQLARQVIEGRKYDSFAGSIFNCLTRMMENPKDFAGKLVGYYNGEVKADHILTDLEITTPKSNRFTSFSETVVFAGNTDPNTDASINGVAIKTDTNGYFTLEMPLAEGKNTFNIEHKGKTATYEITRVIEVIKEVTPTGVINADGATKLKITAVAYSEAAVYAVVNGKTIAMSIDEDNEDESLKNTPYSLFSGSYTIPDATTAVQNLGQITVYGSWNEYKKSKTGATLKVNARALPSDGRPVVVTAQYAETFPSDVLSHYSDPTYFPLPKGALDYAVGNAINYTATVDGKPRSYSFYRLASGLRVLTEDIATVSQANAPVGNRITGATVKSDQRHTTVTIATKQQVSYTARYSSEAVTMEFHFTDSTPPDLSLNQNPLFSTMSFKNGKMTLTLKQKGVFFGYNASYDANGNLVLRFNNPPVVSTNNLTGAKIALDPGHGGVDPGALGYLAAYPEKVINWSIASKVNSILTSRGAEVFMIPSKNYAYQLNERVAMVQDEDPHLLISIHSNSHIYNREAAGTEAYYFTPFSYALASHASSRVAAALNTVNRNAKFGYFAMTRSSQFPSILLECGFVSNQNEYSKLVNDAYQTQIASALADSVAAYFKTMSVGSILTGTQITGTMNKGADAAAPAPTQTPSSSQPEQQDEDEDELTLSEDTLELSVGEEQELYAILAAGDPGDIVWSAQGTSGVVRLVKDSDDPELLVIEALKPGEVTVVATVKSDKTYVAKCVITVR